MNYEPCLDACANDQVEGHRWSLSPGRSVVVAAGPAAAPLSPSPMTPAMHGSVPFTSPRRTAISRAEVAETPLRSLLPPFFDSATAGASPSPVRCASPSRPAQGQGTVCHLASSFMLLEYAAQLKGLSQRNAVRAARRARRLPRECAEQFRATVQTITDSAGALYAHVLSELSDVTSGRRAKRANLVKIARAARHLQAVNELLSHAEVEQVDARKKSRDSLKHAPPTGTSSAFVAGAQSVHSLSASSGGASSAAAAGASNGAAVGAPSMPSIREQPLSSSASASAQKVAAVDGLASLMQGLSSGGASATAASPALPLAAADSQAARNLAALEAQVASLMAQMNLMHTLQTLLPAATASIAAGDVQQGLASCGRTIPPAPRRSIVSMPVTPRSAASAAAAAAAVPLAPPMCTVSVPPAPALHRSDLFFTGVARQLEGAATAPGGPSPFNAAVAARKSAAVAAAAGGMVSVLGEITARSTNLQPAAARREPSATTPLRLKAEGAQATQQVQDAAVVEGGTHCASAASSKLTVAVYTRRIPGCESLSLADSIRVASKIKLRRTELDRSPGGTPRRQGRASSSTQDVLQLALAARFKNVHAAEGVARKEGARAASLFAAPTASISTLHPPKSNTAKRTSSGRRSHTRAASTDATDKENWETS